MRTFFLTVMMTAMTIVPVQAVEFLGIELCKDSASTAVVLPLGSPLTLESAEIGAQGALVLLLRSDDKAILEQIDDLMFDVTGSRGEGDEKSLQWSGNEITAFAQILKKKMAALAINTTDDCQENEETESAETASEVSDSVEMIESMNTAGPPPVPPVVAVAAVPAIESEAEPSVPVSDDDVPADTEVAEFPLEGALQHAAFDDGWVDVMGVVVNNTTENYKLATFDLSLFDASGRLICVDTISVAVLKAGQHRAFRDSIRCPGYRSDAVDRTDLQFAGGH